ncbi:hypothetical protein AWM75_00245 [Aerococcus urinaehominis]|uniref:Uncharacterized protein n=1 Tax=Aerococcus urinaehominis TaxID=128944 RepID=A0A109RGB7_9LACT|nr:N-acetylmuramoyl-L-alanine amidase [Aerococcus urinaehominis]AMB98514.1 hypothetical protein AWM75_00245 [Aerococcus urinaehominis]SDL79997.1 N-acetylmuramoyl-L-alanine amidase [Aerococcus urinaehominis]
MQKVKDHIKTNQNQYIIYLTLIAVLFALIGYDIYQHNKAHSRVIQSPVVNMRQGPSVTYDIQEQVKAGSKYKVLDEKNDWTYIALNNGKVGWIPNWLSTGQLPDEANGFIATVIKDQAQLYDASDQTNVVATADRNQKFPILHQDKGLVQIQLPQSIAWINQADIEITPGNMLNRGHYAMDSETRLAYQEFLANYPASVNTNAEGVNLYSQADTNSEVITTLPNNEQMGYLGQDDIFYQVETIDGQVGYVANWLVTSNADVMAEAGKAARDQGALAGKTIVVDPGHGGEDPGAIDASESVYEKENTLSTANYLKEALEAEGAKVIMTRQEDVLVDLAEIPQIANQAGADAFVSLHYDAAEDLTRSGTTVYYYDEGLSYQLAQQVQAQLMEQGPLRSNGSHFGDYQVLRDNQRPAILLELGYMSNPYDLSTFTQAEYQKTVAKAIVDGLACYLADQQA